MTPYRILVVEDNPLNQKILTFHLKRRGFIVNSVSTGEKALEFLANEWADIVMLDLMLPGINGYEVTFRIREIEKSKGSRIIIIALTANSLDNDRTKCINAGMDEYMLKPFDIKKLNNIFDVLNL